MISGSELTEVSLVETHFLEALTRIPLGPDSEWIVKFTFAWLSLSRRLSKDYKWGCPKQGATIYGAMSRIMLRRLAREA